ncbi:reverse transcriptase domain-containing protein [Tanacetum coccineum]|uniref:Reverse transcriptase domain-containing protein n=1 Tax=Tanacetum coccineum TaxID=301880 RepID=A0ABQ5BLL3_9ASTR
MEAVQDISGCGDNQKVKYSAGSLIGKTLTWWNSRVQTRGREAAVGMIWEDFKALMKGEYCPSNKMHKLETEFLESRYDAELSAMRGRFEFSTTTWHDALGVSEEKRTDGQKWKGEASYELRKPQEEPKLQLLHEVHTPSAIKNFFFSVSFYSVLSL